MIHIDLVIKESLRTKTIIPLFYRQLDEEMNYEGTILPKRLAIFLLSYIMHMDPQLYPDPEKFIPERFLSENLNEKRFPYAAFCGGVRNCIGQKFAMLAIKVAVAKLSLKYKLIEVKDELRLAYEITFRSKTGIRVNFRRKN